MIPYKYEVLFIAKGIGLMFWENFSLSCQFRDEGHIIGKDGKICKQAVSN